MSVEPTSAPLAATIDPLAAGRFALAVQAKLDRQLQALSAPIFQALVDTACLMLGSVEIRLCVPMGGRHWIMRGAGFEEVEDPALVEFLQRLGRCGHPLVEAHHGGDASSARVGWALRRSKGQVLGLLCALGDVAPACRTPDILGTLQRLGDAVFATTEVEICQDSLDQQSTLLQATLDNISQGVCAYDRNERLIAWNSHAQDLHALPDSEFHFGVRFEDVVAHTHRRGATAPPGAQGNLARHRACKISGMPLHTDLTFPDKRVVEVIITYLPEGGFVATYTDVTAQRQAAARLSAAAKRFKIEGRIAAIANEAAQWTTALALVLEALCEELHLDAGRVFLTGSDRTSLEDADIRFDRPVSNGSAEGADRPPAAGLNMSAHRRAELTLALMALADETAIVVGGDELALGDEGAMPRGVAVPFEVMGTRYIIVCVGHTSILPGIIDGDLGGVIAHQLTRMAERDRLQQMKDNFVGAMNHEMRTPLTVIAGVLDLLQADIYGPQPDEAKAALEIAQQNSSRLGALIDDILDLDAVERRGAPFDLKVVPLHAVIEEAVAPQRADAYIKGVRVEVTDPEQLSAIADPQRLTQAVGQLLSNAIKFSPPGASVEIRIGRRDDLARVSLIDRGPGIPESFQLRMFEKFTQADGSDTRSANGTGLGLTIVREIVARLDGALSCESAVGAGTTFHIDLKTDARAAAPNH